MINTIKNALGFGPKVDYKELLKKGAQIIDVRSRGEFASGHVNGSINLPLNELTSSALNVHTSTNSDTTRAISALSASDMVKSILCSLTKNGRYFIFLPVEGNVNS